MLNFQYTQLEGKSAIPIVELYFENPDNPFFKTNTKLAVIDTGSDITIIPYTIISEIRVRDLISTQPINIKGFGRESIGAPYLVKVGFSKDNLIYAKVFVIPDDVLDNQVIIGRDILNLYVITFDGPKLIFTISE
jgi:hypothetical protein